jgi:hypothetical protein
MPKAKQAPTKNSSFSGDNAAKPPSSVAVFPHPQTSPPGAEEQIRRRAYELYEQRGRQDGFSEQDWLRAESEILHRSGKLSA